jgi:uncharacterized iron-regulated membrane protein
MRISTASSKQARPAPLFHRRQRRTAWPALQTAALLLLGLPFLLAGELFDVVFRSDVDQDW